MPNGPTPCRRDFCSWRIGCGGCDLTTIAWDGKSLAADTQINRRDTVSGFATKAVRRNGVIAAACGVTSLAQRFRDWFMTGMDGDAPTMEAGDHAAVGVVITPDGTIIEWNGDSLPDRVRAPFAAWGSGADFAMGAMAQGATAAEAVAVTARLDHNTGGEITVLTLD